MEKWLPIKGYEGYYEVSNVGNVKSLYGWNGHKYIKREYVLTKTIQKVNKNSNYSRYKVTLKKNKARKDFKIHTLVAMAFIENPNNFKCINHKDGNPLNNEVDNLEWCNQKHNVVHAIETGLTYVVYKDIEKEVMLDLLNSNKNYDEIAKILGIAKGTVYNYINRFGIKKYFK